MSRSVSSPEFEYTPSKNVYREKIINLPMDMQGLALTDHATETHRGEWRTQFLSTKGKASPDKPMLHVEVGCNAGHVCLEWAKQNPSTLYIGVDWKYKMIYRLAEKSRNFQVKNLLAFRANADRLPFMFAPGEVDFLHMFFPDPWPKKAHQKNRTASVEWLNSIAPLLSGRGYFHLKTDHAAYYDFIRDNLEQLKDTFEIIEETRDLHAGNPKAKLLQIPDVTLFERLFIKDGLPIHSVKVRIRTPKE